MSSEKIRTSEDIGAVPPRKRASPEPRSDVRMGADSSRPAIEIPMHPIIDQSEGINGDLPRFFWGLVGLLVGFSDLLARFFGPLAGFCRFPPPPPSPQICWMSRVRCPLPVRITAATESHHQGRNTRMNTNDRVVMSDWGTSEFLEKDWRTSNLLVGTQKSFRGTIGTSGANYWSSNEGVAYL